MFLSGVGSPLVPQANTDSEYVLYGNGPRCRQVTQRIAKEALRTAAKHSARMFGSRKTVSLPQLYREISAVSVSGIVLKASKQNSPGNAGLARQFASSAASLHHRCNETDFVGKLIDRLAERKNEENVSQFPTEPRRDSTRTHRREDLRIWFVGSLIEHPHPNRTVFISV